MTDYRDTLRLAREVDEVKTALATAASPEDVTRLQARVDALHVRVGEALAAHVATRPWYSRWLWSLRLWRFDRRGAVRS